MPLNHSLFAPRAVKARRLLGAAVLISGLLGTSACGMNVQTNQPYTPADGVNADVPSTGNADDVVHVRNLGIISRTPGEGILNGSLVGTRPDALTGVSGKSIKLDGSDGAPLKVELNKPVEIGRNSLVVLTSASPLITIQAADLDSGLDAVVDLQFRNAGQVSIRVPVLDGNQPQYRTITPAPTPETQSPTPSPTPSQ